MPRLLPAGLLRLFGTALVLGVLSVAPLQGQQFEGSAFVGTFLPTQNLTEEFSLNVDGAVRTALQSHENGLTFGANAGVRWDRLAVEGQFAYISTNILTEISGIEDITTDQNIMMISGNVLYDILPGDFFDLFVAGGAGIKQYSADDPAGGFSSGSDFMFNFGAGGRLAVTETLSLRLDVRDYVSSFDAFEADANSEQGARTQHDVLITIGLSYTSR
mgnify:CR=1 FL=1|jgi:hypothetical protein